MSYVINSFNNFAIPEISRLNISRTLSSKWLNKLIPIPDKNPRIIFPLLIIQDPRNARYRTYQENTVITKMNNIFLYF